MTICQTNIFYYVLSVGIRSWKAETMKRGKEMKKKSVQQESREKNESNIKVTNRCWPDKRCSFFAQILALFFLHITCFTNDPHTRPHMVTEWLHTDPIRKDNNEFPPEKFYNLLSLPCIVLFGYAIRCHVCHKTAFTLFPFSLSLFVHENFFLLNLCSFGESWCSWLCLWKHFQFDLTKLYWQRLFAPI